MRAVRRLRTGVGLAGVLAAAAFVASPELLPATNAASGPGVPAAAAAAAAGGTVTVDLDHPLSTFRPTRRWARASTGTAWATPPASTRRRTCTRCARRAYVR